MRTSILFFVLACFAGFRAQAQDLLTKRSGEEINVKIVEITPSEVKYRRTDNPDGPLISLWKSDVFMVRYANGTKEVFGPKPAAPVVPEVPATTTGLPPTGTTVPGDAPVLPDPIHLDGPRVGFTVLSNGVKSRANENGADISNFITQFGWQFETRLFRMPNGVSGLVEFVPLVGGLDQGQFLPSLSTILGVRGPQGMEFGVGPNLTPLGASLVLAVGTSFTSSGINFPVNLAVVPGRDGVRASLLLGFNARRR
jgi:hypothetical protein